MGMFDTIIGGKIKCPNCNKVTVIDFQTKDGFRSMSWYRIGDKFPLTDEECGYSMDRKSYTATGLGLCRKCNAFFDAFIRINVRTKKITGIDIYRYGKDCDIKITKKSMKKSMKK